MPDFNKTSVTTISRRNFLRSASAVVAVAAIPELIYSCKGKKQRKMILSFYMDDTNPEHVKADAYKDFVDYCHTYGIKGESSLLLGYNGKSMVMDSNDNRSFYLSQVKESYRKGIDTHMEIMTHEGLFDFKDGKMKEEGIHEGLWLHEPGVTVGEYQSYFDSIIGEAKKAGIKFTGLTWPGCGCDA